MNESKVRGLKWNMKKLRGSVLYFTQSILSKFLVFPLKKIIKKKKSPISCLGQILSLKHVTKERECFLELLE